MSCWGTPWAPRSLSAVSRAPSALPSKALAPVGERATSSPSHRTPPDHAVLSRAGDLPVQVLPPSRGDARFRSPALGDNRSGSPRQFKPHSLAHRRISALTEAPAHCGGEGRRSAPVSADQVHSPARPGFGTRTRSHPGLIPRSAVSSRH
ncbi:hypothetical protein NDU88_006750 [Pleurodeles waltl]|uniref:Uncharacterized protein n=1 Tax=Pleurodeles waltl TaxID=8319 RepID=A0AAV7RSW7_PLEWA|nr:hypothetical protein NDU88_006750 [Pleurodeles waltl]